MTEFVFGARSERHMATLVVQWRTVLHRALDYGVMDFAVLQGFRDQAAQDEAFARGASKLRWPHSVHNTSPSRAVDLAPWPIDWNDSLAFARLAGLVAAAAAEEGFAVRWGGDWDSDGSSRDQSFMDIGHFELVLD